MKSLNDLNQFMNSESFDLDHEAAMVQSRVLSPIIEAIEEKKLTQEKLSELTGLTQPFISSLLNIRKKLSVEHIALFQKALGIVLQPPSYLTSDEHKSTFYSTKEYDLENSLFIRPSCVHDLDESLDNYTNQIVGDHVWKHAHLTISKSNRKLNSVNRSTAHFDKINLYGR